MLANSQQRPHQLRGNGASAGADSGLGTGLGAVGRLRSPELEGRSLTGANEDGRGGIPGAVVPGIGVGAVPGGRPQVLGDIGVA